MEFIISIVALVTAYMAHTKASATAQELHKLKKSQIKEEV